MDLENLLNEALIGNVQEKTSTDNDGVETETLDEDENVVVDENESEEEVVDEGVVADDEVDEEETDSEDDESEDESEEDDDSVDYVKTISDLAKVLDVDPADLYAIEIPLKDGKGRITLSEMKDEYQSFLDKQAEYETVQQEIEETKQKLAQEYQQIQEMANVIPQSNQEVINAIAKIQMIELQAEQLKPELTRLQYEDPDKAKAIMFDLEQQYNEAAQELQKAKSVTEQVNQQRQQEIMAQEQRLLVQAIPEWKDPEVLKQDVQGITQLANNYGFKEEELNNVIDHRIFKLLKDYHDLKNQVENGRKKVRKPIKAASLKPGQKTDKLSIKKRNVKKTMQKAKQARTLKEREAALAEALKLTGL